ncbi:MAG TPA: ABC transporter substrate-binding protein, partial [Marinobacter sp.]|nr:ABC transporter substrate-binding protein [Marinobacter sp.]
NVIVEGVNIGLAFRDRFSQEMEASRDQVQVVIDGWNGAVDSLNLKQAIDETAGQ